MIHSKNEYFPEVIYSPPYDRAEVPAGGASARARAAWLLAKPKIYVFHLLYNPCGTPDETQYYEEVDQLF